MSIRIPKAYKEVIKCVFECDNVSCPFAHTDRIQKIEEIKEIKYKHGIDYISKIPDSILEMIGKYIGNELINLIHVSKSFRLLYVRNRHFVVACEDFKGICIADQKTFDYKTLSSIDEEIHICIDPTVNDDIISKCHYDRTVIDNIYGLCITNNCKNKFTKKKYYNQVRFPTEYLRRVEYLQYNNMPLTHAECTIPNTVKELVITKCFQAVPCNLVPDGLTNIEYVTIKDTLLKTDISFPTRLKGIALDVLYTRSTLKNICRCYRLERLDIPFTRFLCGYFALFPATLRILNIRMKRKCIDAGIVTLNMVHLAIRLCTGYNIEGAIVESSLALRGDIVYYKYQYKNMVVVLHV